MFGLAAIATLFQPIFLASNMRAPPICCSWPGSSGPDAAAPVEAEPVRGRGMQLFGAALLLSLGNPKIMLFYLALMPTVIDLAQPDGDRHGSNLRPSSRWW